MDKGRMRFNGDSDRLRKEYFLNPTTRRNTAFQRFNIVKLKNIASECGLKLSGFRSNNALEVYFDVHRDDKSLCYLYKGWADSGFRLSALVQLRESDKDLRRKFAEIFKICSRNLLVLSVPRPRGGYLEVNVEAVVYRDGLNSRVFEQAVITLEKACCDISLLFSNR